MWNEPLMPAHAALLRGMNVGGHRITNADLGEAFEGLGFEEVSTYRASGNVIFESDRRAEGELVAEIEEGLEEALGYAVPTFIRSASQLHGIAAFDPFDLDRVAESDGKLQVSLLARKPTKAQREQVLELATDADPLVVVEREIYWLPNGGVLESALDLEAIDAITGPCTRRTMGTMEGMAAKLPEG